MRIQEFDQQVNRLKDCFGDRSYSDERMKVIWKEVRDFDGFWFSRTVDKLIGECRQAPLMQEFREEIAKERERLWQLEKKERAKEAKEFFEGTYAPEDKKTICQYIQKRLRNEVSDAEYETFLKHLNHAASSITPNKCNTCSDSGLVFQRDQENYEWVYRCFCSQGDKQPKAYQRFQGVYA